MFVLSILNGCFGFQVSKQAEMDTKEQRTSETSPGSTAVVPTEQEVSSDTGPLSGTQQSASLSVTESKTSDKTCTGHALVNTLNTSHAVTVSQSNTTAGHFIGPCVPTKADGLQSQPVHGLQTHDEDSICTNIPANNQMVLHSANNDISILQDDLNCSDSYLQNAEDIEPASKRIKADQNVYYDVSQSEKQSALEENVSWQQRGAQSTVMGSTEQMIATQTASTSAKSGQMDSHFREQQKQSVQLTAHSVATGVSCASPQADVSSTVVREMEQTDKIDSHSAVDEAGCHGETTEYANISTGTQ